MTFPSSVLKGAAGLLCSSVVFTGCTSPEPDLPQADSKAGCETLAPQFFDLRVSALEGESEEVSLDLHALTKAYHENNPDKMLPYLHPVHIREMGGD